MNSQKAVQFAYLTLFIGSLYIFVNSEDISNLCNDREKTDSDLGTLCNNLITDSKVRNRRSGGSYVRFGRSVDNGKSYVRFGRSAEPKRSDYVRFGRSAEKPNTNPATDYLKSFGTVDQQYKRNARSSEPLEEPSNLPTGGDEVEELAKRYMRFGKREDLDDTIDDVKRYMRFGKRLTDETDEDKRYMRFGKRYMRFGRGDEIEGDDIKRYMRFGRDPLDKRYMRFGRGDDDSLASTEDKRAFGSKRYMRFGKRDNDTQDLKSKLNNEINDDKRFSLKRYMRFGKRDDDSLFSEEDKRYMRFGRDTSSVNSV